MNVVRLLTEVPPAVTPVLGPLLTALEEAGEADLFLSYRADAAINRAVWVAADAQLLWGGDAKEMLFADYPVHMGGNTLDFSDRFRAAR